jgi:hypothetical protein
MLLHSRADSSSDFFIDDIRVASGPDIGVSIDGSLVEISESLCADLMDGGEETIILTYSVVGSLGWELPKTAIFKLSTTTDGPLISSNLRGTTFIKSGAFCFDLSSDYRNRIKARR